MSKKIKIEKLIEKIEGEAKLKFHFQNEKIDFVDIVFSSTRGIEEILKNRAAADALAINPRVCGICGHAHLIATVKALESCYESIEVSQKAHIIRELTLNFELIQNHFKWFYLTLLPLLGKRQNIPQASKISSMMAKAIAILAGQYPHNSYAIVGGVVCDPTFVEIIQVKNIIKDAIDFFENHMIAADTKELMMCEKTDALFAKEGDLPAVLNEIVKNRWHYLGKSYDQFIVFGENGYFKRGKSIKTRIQPHISEKFVIETPNKESFAKNVQYKNKYYEVGALSRAMLLKTPLIKDSHRRYGDSLFSRILARVCESVELLHYNLELLDKIDINQPSFIEPENISNISAEGIGSVEAARGSLIHKVKLNEGLIEEYQIITPTQWNLSCGTKEIPGIAQKAMIGLDNETLAEFVFKSFDVCSVCTTQ